MMYIQLFLGMFFQLVLAPMFIYFWALVFVTFCITLLFGFVRTISEVDDYDR